MPMNGRLLRPRQTGFTPRSISGLALWLDAADSSTLYTTDAGPVTAVSAPTEISGCVGWYDFSDSSSLTVTSGSIGACNDKSGNGFHLSASSTNRPTLASAVRNGRNAAEFDGVNDLMTATFSGTYTAATVFAVVYPDTAGGGSLGRILTRGASNLAYDGTNTALRYNAPFTGATGNGGQRTANGSAAQDQWHLASFTWNGGLNVATDITPYLSGVTSNAALTGTGDAVSTTGINDFILGNRSLADGADRGWDGYIGEVIIFNVALSTANRARVEAYLAAKWGIAGVHAPATATNDPVGAWLDKSGSGYHATQTTGANRPSRQLAVRNGRSTLRWDGSNDSYRVASIPLDATISVFVVARFAVAGTAGNATGNLFIEHSPNVNTNSGFTFAGSDNAPLVVHRTAAPAFRRAILGVTSWLGTSWAVAEGRIAAAANMVAAADYWRNGGLQSDGSEITGGGFGTGTITSSRSVTADLFIGSRNQASVFSNGDYAEILIYNRPLTDAEHTAVRRYLAAKWGITLYSPPTYADADVNAYISAVEIADGAVALEPGVRDAINDFVVGCKADGIWSSIKASCLLMGARTLAGALTPLKYGAELWTAPTPAITALQGASGSWDAATKTMSSLTTGTSGTTPRFNFDLGLVAGVRYKVSGRLSGDTALVGSVRLGTSLLTYNSTTGEISGTIAAVDSTLAVYFNSTQGPASASIVSLSVMEDWTPTNNGPFVAGDYNRKTGLVGDASTKYLVTNRAGNADPQNNNHIAVYASTAHSNAGNAGAYIATGGIGGLAGASDIGRSGSNTANLFSRSRSSTSFGISGAGPATGLIGLSRSASVSYSQRANGSSSFATVTSETPASPNYHVFRFSDASGYCNGRLAFYSAGESLNLASLDSRVTTLYNAIGAAIP